MKKIDCKSWSLMYTRPLFSGDTSITMGGGGQKKILERQKKLKYACKKLLFFAIFMLKLLNLV